MKFLRIIIVVFAMFILHGNAGAQQVWRRLNDSVKGHCVSFGYNYSGTVSGARMSGNGDVKVQEGRFRFTGNGMEVICDGKSKWTIDKNSKEVVIESVASVGSVAESVNPALIICDLEHHFSVVSSVSEKKEGKNIERISLKPLSSVLGIISMTIYVNAEVPVPLVTSASVKMKDNSEIVFTISSMTFSALEPSSSFVFNDSVLDSSWVVTDLR